MSALDKAKIYAELTKIKIPLNYEDIPTPTYIQERTFECNEANRKVEKFYLTVNQELSSKRRQFKVEKFNFDAKKRQTLTNNDKIKKIPTGKEREAAVEELLENDMRTILDLENETNDLKDLMDAIKMVQANLKTTASDIRVQLRVMEQQINRLNVGMKEDPEVSDLNKALAEIDDLEKEMTVDDVESSTEEPFVESGDESAAAETTPEVVSGGDGQDATSVESDEDAASSSFLLDDSDDFNSEESDDITDEEETAETSTDALDEIAEDVSIPEDAHSESAGAATKEESFDLDLSDIGIDIDLDIEETTKPSTPVTGTTQKETTTTKPKAESAQSKSTQPGTKAAEKKKDTPPAEKRKEASPPPAVQSSGTKSAETPKKEITDVDLDDILTMLD